MSRKEALSSFIQQIHGRPVVVKLNSGVDYRGGHGGAYSRGAPLGQSTAVSSWGRSALVQAMVQSEEEWQAVVSFCEAIMKTEASAHPNEWPSCPGHRDFDPDFHPADRVLACLDGYMNIALEQTEEYVNGQLKNKYGDAFIRGNNVLYISTQKRRI